MTSDQLQKNFNDVNKVAISVYHIFMVNKVPVALIGEYQRNSKD